MKKITMIAISLMVILGGCAKDGKDGMDGMNGAPGADGKDGNANVENINFTLYSYDWEDIGDGWYLGEYTNSLISSEIVNDGAVLAYISIGEDTWLAIPFGYYSFAITDGEIGIYYSGGENPSTQNFKIVILAGSVMSRSKDVDFSNYQEVKTVFNLKEEIKQ